MLSYRLDKKILIKNKITTKNSIGGNSTTYDASIEMWANVKEKSVSTINSDDKYIYTKEYEIITRPFTIAMDSIIEYEGIELTIVSKNEIDKSTDIIKAISRK